MALKAAQKIPDPKVIDPWLYTQTARLTVGLRTAEHKMRAHGDLRWFFTFAHRRITEQISEHLKEFDFPNELLRFNLHFGNAYLNALHTPPSHWRAAFIACKAFEMETMFGLGLPVKSVEECATFMAFVHIRFDIAAALRKVGCVSVNDFARVLPFIQNGAKGAMVELRGKFLGELEHTVAQYVFPMEKVLRNLVYKEVCGVEVPEPPEAYIRRVRQRR